MTKPTCRNYVQIPETPFELAQNLLAGWDWNGEYFESPRVLDGSSYCIRINNVPPDRVRAECEKGLRWHREAIQRKPYLSAFHAAVKAEVDGWHENVKREETELAQRLSVVCCYACRAPLRPEQVVQAIGGPLCRYCYERDPVATHRADQQPAQHPEPEPEWQAWQTPSDEWP